MSICLLPRANSRPIRARGRSQWPAAYRALAAAMKTQRQAGVPLRDGKGSVDAPAAQKRTQSVPKPPGTRSRRADSLYPQGAPEERAEGFHGAQKAALE